MLIELFIFSIVIIAYGIFITTAIFGINNLNRNLRTRQQIINHPFLSIVVSVRNEEENVERFVDEIKKQTYPKNNFELIVIDDFSVDNTLPSFKLNLEKSGLNYKIINQLSHKGKKYNISEAIKLAEGTIIITTDADVCYRDANWLKQIASYFENNNPDLLIMPIDFDENASVLSQFQITENIALTAITAGFCGINRPFMCNGANLAFLKLAYENVNGYSNHLHISSGEDVFLLEDLKKINSNKIHYSWQKELIVRIKPIQTVSEFFAQRLRWAYKAKYNSNSINLSFGFIVLCANLIFLVLVVSLIKNQPITPYLAIFVLTKLIFDFLLLFLASKFLGRVKYLALLIPFECVYWLYALMVGLGSLFIKPSWKGIKVK
jgi:biofilm PGA synthesis N-glycosyltransferase PgaC